MTATPKFETVSQQRAPSSLSPSAHAERVGVVAAPANGAHAATRNGTATLQGDIRTILQPVQHDLSRVEQKMKLVDSSLFAPLADAFVDLIGSGGKRLRPALALLTSQLHVAEEAAETDSVGKTAMHETVLSIAAAVEMLHTATLVHDDVIDGALLRRGAPTLNASWSKGATVLAGNYMFAQAAHFAAETNNMRVIYIFSDTLNVIVNGEMQQIFARHSYAQERQEYYDRIYAKTASLFSAATESAAILAGLPDELVQQLKEFGYNLGMAFQIVDDILDFTGDESSLGKPAGSDLRQGTLTLPFFYFLQDQAEPEAMINRLKAARAGAGDTDESAWTEAVAAIVEQVRSSGAVAAAQREAAEFLAKARANLQPLPNVPARRSMLALCDFVVQRTY